jgi:hypothetical protein
LAQSCVRFFMVEKFANFEANRVRFSLEWGLVECHSDRVKLIGERPERNTIAARAFAFLEAATDLGRPFLHPPCVRRF